MRKQKLVTIRIVALALAATFASWSCAKATPYATCLTNDNGIVSFRLNESADSVKVIGNFGSLTNDLGLLPRGLIVTNLTGSGMSSGDFQVEVFKTAASQIVTNGLGIAFNSPRGVTVNVRPGSPFFGRVYVANSAVGTKGDGIFVFNADLSDAFGQGSNALTAGINFTTGGANTPYRLKVGHDDDQLYICDWSDQTGNLYVTDPDVSSNSFQYALKQLTGTSSVPVGGSNTHGSVAAVEVTGSLLNGDLKIFTIDEDYQTDPTSSSPTELNSLWEYDVNTGPLPWNNPPDVKLLTPAITNISQTMDLARGTNGHSYVIDARINGGEAGLFVIDSAGTVLFNSHDESVAEGYNVDVLTNSVAVVVSPDGLYAAVLNIGNIITVLPLTNGVPNLAARFRYTGFGTTANGRGLAFDVADNLYMVSSGLGILQSLSLGLATTTTSGTDGSFMLNFESAAPTIYQEPVDVTAFEHQTVTLQIRASGPQPLTYQWYLNSMPVSGSNFIGANSDTLIIKDASLALNGSTFRCDATNTSGTTPSFNAMLTVLTPPAVSIAYLRTLVDTVNYNATNSNLRWQATGVVTTFTNLASGDTSSYYLQDDTAGINIFVNHGHNFRPAQGDVVKFVGVLMSFNSNLELMADTNDLSTSFTIISNNFALPSAKPIAFSITNNLAFCETNLEGSLVMLTNVFFGTNAGTKISTNANTVVIVTNANGETFRVMFSPQDLDTAGRTVPIHASSVVGPLTQFLGNSITPRNQGYQITVTRISDITDSYALNLPSGYSLIANQLNLGGNTLQEVLTNVPNLTRIYKWNSGLGTYSTYTYSSISGLWTGPGGPGTLAPGEGAFIQLPSARTLTFTGTPNVPVLPVSITCGHFYLMSRQTNDVGTFENITGLAPQEGTELFRFNSGTPATALQSPNYTTYIFSGGAWLPYPPSVNVGEAVWIVMPCASNSCISLQCPADIIVTSSTITPVSYAPIVTNSCSSTFVNLLCRPASGSPFPPGTTPVHCVAIDDHGNAATCDFTVTVAPPPQTPPVFSYTNNVPSSLSLIANQFDHGGNTLREVLPSVPDGSVVSKYDNTNASWYRSVYSARLGAWVPANITLSPGEGAFFQSPTNFSLAFSGTAHVPVLPVAISNGATSLLSRQTAQIGNFADITGSSPTNGAKVYKWNILRQDYDTNIFASGSWTSNGIPVPFEPTAAVGESMWIAPSGGGPPPPVPVPPAISPQPTSLSVTQGGTATFTVGITNGTIPFKYQWRLNGNNIPGATSSGFTLLNVQTTNAGSYDVVVYNIIGAVSSDVASLTISNLALLPFADNFTNAGSLGSVTNASLTNGVGAGSNVGATNEVGEPEAGHVPGGASVWVSWQPTNSGIATFSTAGSGFDTVLAIYSGNQLSNLVSVAADDDSAGFLCSSASFNVAAGTNYVIQLDGHYRAMGNIVLSWALEVTSNRLPVIVTQPRSQTAAVGSNVTLSVVVQTNPVIVYQWFKNDTIIDAATNSTSTNSTLTLSNLANAHVGLYHVKVTDSSAGRSLTSRRVKVQINSAGSGQPINADARAEDKFRAATDSSRVGTEDPDDPSLVTGYTSTQVFTTYGASTDPNEPSHCGYPPCKTYWGSYVAPATGRLTHLRHLKLRAL